MLEVGALLLLTLGSLLSWVGWAGGVVLLWTSDRWTRRDKVLGTFVLPGGLLPAALFVHGPATTTCLVVSDGAPGRAALLPSSCRDPALHTPLLLAVTVVLVVAPLAVVARLGWRARREPAG